MQTYWIGHGVSAREIQLPPADSEVVQGVSWGRADMLDTPAYWALRCHTEEDPLHGFTSSSSSLIEEIGFCLLGGFGITAELNTAAFERLRNADVFDLTNCFRENDIRALLLEPLPVGGKFKRFRFPNQRAKRLSAMRQMLGGLDLSDLPIDQLNILIRKIPGIGPKTAAWVIRNHYSSDDVAILDVHVIRACSRFRLFPAKFSLPRDYGALEQRFLTFARAIDVRPAILDAVMWTEMRSEPRTHR